MHVDVSFYSFNSNVMLVWVLFVFFFLIPSGLILFSVLWRMLFYLFIHLCLLPSYLKLVYPSVELPVIDGSGGVVGVVASEFEAPPLDDEPPAAQPIGLSSFICFIK